MSGESPGVFRFGESRLSVEPLALYHRDQLVPLPPKVVLTLLVLVKARGAIVSKTTLVQEIWPDTFVEEGGLARNVYLLRRALDQPGQPSCIETAHRRGYRFTRRVTEDGSGVSPEPASLVSVRGTPPFGGEMPANGGEAAEPLSAPFSPAAAPDGNDRAAARWPGWRAIRGVVIWGTVIGLTGVAGAVARWGWPTPPAVATSAGDGSAGPKAIAVLPFRSLADRGAGVYLAHGMTDGLAGRLAQVPGLRTRPTGTVHAVRSGDPFVSGRALRVDYVLDGTITDARETVDIAVRLLAVADERQVWTGEFRVRASDVPAQQIRIVQAALRAMGMALADADRGGLAGNEPPNRRAYELYCKARFLWHQGTAESVAHAAVHFEEATRADPGFALAFAGLAAAQAYMPDGLSSAASPSLLQARETARHALSLDRTIASAHGTLGIVALLVDGDAQTAERELTRALELDAGDVLSREWLAIALLTGGQRAAAIEQLEVAVTYDPWSPRLHTLLAAAHYLDRRYAEAIVRAEAALARNPTLAEPRVWRGLAYAALGDLEGAGEDLTEAVEHEPRNPSSLAALGYVRGLQHRRAEVVRTLEQLQAGAFVRPVNPFHLALIHLGIDDVDAAISDLKGCLNYTCHPTLHLAREDPRLEPLRRDARFRAITEAMGSRTASATDRVAGGGR